MNPRSNLTSLINHQNIKSRYVFKIKFAKGYFFMNVEMKKVKKSTNVDSIGYDEFNQELYVTFKGGSKVYCYEGVPKKEFKMLEESDSKGKYIIEKISKQYKYKKPDQEVKIAEKKEIGWSYPSELNKYKPLIINISKFSLEDIVNDRCDISKQEKAIVIVQLTLLSKLNKSGFLN